MKTWMDAPIEGGAILLALAVRSIRRKYFSIFKCYRTLETICATYTDADKLIREAANKPEREQWVISPIEDRNKCIGIVFLERRERITE